MKYELYSRLSLRRYPSLGFLARSGTHALFTPEYTMFDFQSRTKFVFSLHNTEMKLALERAFHLNELIPKGKNGNEMSFWYHVKKKYREIYKEWSKLKIESLPGVV